MTFPSDRPDDPAKTNPDAAGQACDACDPADVRLGGPPREGGGTTGAGNLTAGQANRNGGSTDNVADAGTGVAPPRRGVEPSA